jgi:hypothetical protein
MHKTSKGILVIEVVVAKRNGYLNKSAGQQFGGKKLGWNQGVFPSLSHTGRIRTWCISSATLYS